MAKNSCVTRIVNSINKSSIKSVDKQELINKIKTAVADSKKTNLDKVDIDKISKDVTEQIKAQKRINKIYRKKFNYWVECHIELYIL